MIFKTKKINIFRIFTDLTEYIYIEKGSKTMKKTRTERAYEAIKQHVQTHVTGDADDLCCACCNAYDRQKDKYDEAIGEIEDFAIGVAFGQLSNEFDAADSRKDREEVYADWCALFRGEEAEKRRVRELVARALSELSTKDRGILAWELCGLSLILLAEIWGISKQAFFRCHVNPAQDAFAEAYGKVVGNEKWYAQLRREMKNKKKGN